MNYEIVTLAQKKVAGLKTSTNNTAPDMGEKIGRLWQDFYSGAYESIPGKTNSKAIGLYTNYAADFTGDYDMYVCCEVSDTSEMPDEFETAVIPAGKYAKFTVLGDVQKDVAAFWAQLWSMEDLPRAYGCDFEEYQPGGDMQHGEIHIYISLKE